MDGPAYDCCPLLGLFGKIALKKFINCLVEEGCPAVKMSLLERHAQVLHSLGCHVMQGYLFSRALPAEDFERWVSRARIQPGAPWIVMAQEPL
jgi:hypothetical protein